MKEQEQVQNKNKKAESIWDKDIEETFFGAESEIVTVQEIIQQDVQNAKETDKNQNLKVLEKSKKSVKPQKIDLPKIIEEQSTL